MFDDGAAEGLALLGVGVSRLQCRTCAAGGLGGYADAPERQVSQRDAEAPPDLAEHIAGRHPHVFEHHLAGVIRAVAELVLLGDHAVAGIVGRRDERRHPPFASARVRHCHDHRHVCAGTRRDEGFVSVQHVLVSVPLGSGANGRRVRAGLWLGEVDAAQPRAAGELGEIVAPLLIGAGLLDRHSNRRVVGRHHVADPSVRSGDLLDGQCVRHEVGAGTAPAGIDNHPHQTDVGHLAVQLTRRSPGAVPLGCEGGDLALSEAPRHVTNLLLLVGQLHCALPVTSLPRHPAPRRLGQASLARSDLTYRHVKSRFRRTHLRGRLRP